MSSSVPDRVSTPRFDDVRALRMRKYCGVCVFSAHAFIWRAQYFDVARVTASNFTMQQFHDA
jgi:hypothetical protein